MTVSPTATAFSVRGGRADSNCPASCVNQPTWGRVSRAGVLDLAPTLDHVGPMARSVADCAITLQVNQPLPFSLSLFSLNAPALTNQTTIASRPGLSSPWSPPTGDRRPRPCGPDLAPGPASHPLHTRAR